MLEDSRKRKRMRERENSSHAYSIYGIKNVFFLKACDLFPENQTDGKSKFLLVQKNPVLIGLTKPELNMGHFVPSPWPISCDVLLNKLKKLLLEIK